MEKIVVVGATGNVGRKVVELLLQRNIVYPDSLRLLASPKSAGKKIKINDTLFSVEATQDESFNEDDLCIFNTESDVSSYYIPKALSAGSYVIDSSSHYRLYEDVPLIIPPVNRDAISLNQKLYAHANCIASPIATVLAPLHKAMGISRIEATSYQSTSGAGKAAMDDCFLETKSVIEKTHYQRSCFKRQIAFNVIPQVGDIREDGYTFEEYKIINEVQKVVGREILMTATSVRVPVMVGHSISLNIEFKKKVDLADVIEILKNSPYVKISKSDYTTPVEIVGSEDVHVGRIRHDMTSEHRLHLWLCSDNLMRGAAVDAVEIADTLIRLMKAKK